MRKLLLLFLVTASICFAQKKELSSGRDYYSTVVSGGINLGHRWYNQIEYGDLPSHTTFGINLEYNFRIHKQFYTGIGIESSDYNVYNNNYQIISLYVQPAFAYNVFKGAATLFAGIKGELINDGRFKGTGTGISPFVRCQYNFFRNVCIGFQIGARKFFTDKITVKNIYGNFDVESKNGYSLENFLYIGWRFEK
jgi:hypothetical protein